MRALTTALAAACAAALTSPTFPVLLARNAESASQSAARPTIFIDANVVDGAGRAITTLTPQELRVTVDGERREVVSLRFVYRGPGALTAAVLSDPARDAPTAAERTRSLLMLVDENGIFPGRQKPLVAVVTRLMDELGAVDRSAVATLPRPPEQLVLSASAAGRQDVLGRVVGRATADAQTSAQALPSQPVDPIDPAAAAAGGELDEQTRLQLEREAARVRQMRQDELTVDLGGARRATASVPALGAIVESLAGMPGLKSVVVFRQAEWSSEAASADDARGAIASVLAAAARARVVVHLVMVGQPGRKGSPRDDAMSAIVAGTGGTTTLARNSSDTRALDGIRAVLWGGYLVEVEGREGDDAARPHAVKIECARSTATVRAPASWVLRPDPVPEVALRPSPPPPAAAAGTAPRGESAAPAAPTPRRARADDPQLTLLLARLAEFVGAYIRDLGNVVAEEDYYQRLVRGAVGPNTARRLKSDLLLVKTEDDVGWTLYRDVFEVDGRAVRDREARVQKLFIENTADAWRLAREVTDEGARYNIGSVLRNINTPTLPLEYLSPKRIGGLSFWRDGEDSIDGVSVVRLAFEEMERPTWVRSNDSRGDVPASGTLWVDPSNGRILRTRIKLTSGTAEMTTTVSYKPSQVLGLSVPSEMNEKYTNAIQDIEGRAAYSNFRSFKVTTEMEMKK